MSSDTVFWRAEGRRNHTPEEIYTSLVRGQPVDGVQKLPIRKLLKQLKEKCPSFDPKAETPVLLISDEGAEVSWSDYHLRLSHHGGAIEPVATVREITKVLGCSMYSPATKTLCGPEESEEAPELVELGKVTELSRQSLQALARLVGDFEAARFNNAVTQQAIKEFGWSAEAMRAIKKALDEEIEKKRNASGTT